MKDVSSLHLKVQEQIDCQGDSDPIKAMSAIAGEPDSAEAAVKWLALAALHGITGNAEKITVARDEAGKVTVTAEYRTAQLPSPGDAVGAKVIETMRAITHITEDEGRMPLALGIRDSSVELHVKLKRKKGGEKLTLNFPQ